MSYISAIRSRDEVLVWERNDRGRELKTYKAPYYFYYLDKQGNHTSMYGDKLTRVDFDTSQEYYQAKKEHADKKIRLFESDISAELRVLSSRYYGKPAPKLHVSFIDIEVDYSTEIGFSTIENPYAPINSVAIYHSWLKKMIVMAIPPPEFTETDPEVVKQMMGAVSPMPTDVEVEVRLYGTEKQLLMELMYELQDTDVMSGWNSDFFDVPYIGKRLEKFGKRAFKLLSFPEGNEPKWREVETAFRKNWTLDLSGRVSVDYLVLFRKYEQEQRPSYKLESIAEELLPDLPKLQYEGSLAQLYRKDFAWFIRYNLRDTEILKGFEERLGYVELANQMCHLSTGLFQHVNGTLKLAELSVINMCHHELDVIVNDNRPPDEDRPIKGALVLLPQKGLVEYAGAIDIKSLYPSAIRSLNISPETLRGQFVEEFQASEELARGSEVILTLLIEDGTTMEFTAKKWREVLRQRKWAVSGYGTVFDQTKQGIIPAILEKWFNTRIEYQRLLAEAAENKDKIKTVYYDKLQYTYKIKLNSFYGALTNLHFRFFDLRMGESVTATGRAILTHQCRKVSELLGDKYDVDFPQYESVNDHKDSRHGERGKIDPRTTLNEGFGGEFPSHPVIYGDTDSTYFRTYTETKEEAILIADLVAAKVNASYKPYMREAFLCNDGFDDIISCSREIITDRGIFVDKKRYILHLVDKDGKAVDKMKVMGLDTKKTTLPKAVSKKLNKFIEQFLKGMSWKEIEQQVVAYKDELLGTKDIMTIGLPKGINGIEDYTAKMAIDKNSRTPGHVMAAIFYNRCLDQFQDKVSPPIFSGTKIKVFYLKQTYGRFKSVAIPVDIEQVPKWFEEEFVVDRDMHIQRLVDNPLQNIIKAIGKKVPSKQSLLFDSLFDD